MGGGRVKHRGPPGFPGDVAWSVPVVVLRLVKHLHAHAMQAYLAAHGVERVFIGRQDNTRPQMRAHANSARASAAPGQGGVEERNALQRHGAWAVGFADVDRLSSETPTQEEPLGDPNTPGSLWGLAQRGGRALAKLTTGQVLFSL
jgi:hypothetical protein